MKQSGNDRQRTVTTKTIKTDKVYNLFDLIDVPYQEHESSISLKILYNKKIVEAVVKARCCCKTR